MGPWLFFSNRSGFSVALELRDGGRLLQVVATGCRVPRSTYRAAGLSADYSPPPSPPPYPARHATFVALKAAPPSSSSGNHLIPKPHSSPLSGPCTCSNLPRISARVQVSGLRRPSDFGTVPYVAMEHKFHNIRHCGFNRHP